MKRALIVVILLIGVFSIAGTTFASGNNHVFYFVAQTDVGLCLLSYDVMNNEYSYETLENNVYIVNNDFDETGFYMVEAVDHQIPICPEFSFMHRDIISHEPFSIYYYTNESCSKIADNIYYPNLGKVVAYIDNTIIYYNTSYTLTIVKDSSIYEYDHPIYKYLSFVPMCCSHVASPEKQLWIVDSIDDLSSQLLGDIPSIEDGTPFIIITDGNVITDIITLDSYYGDKLALTELDPKSMLDYRSKIGIIDLQYSFDDENIYVLVADSTESPTLTSLLMFNVINRSWSHICDISEECKVTFMHITNDGEWMVSGIEASSESAIILTSLENGESTELLTYFKSTYPELGEMNNVFPEIGVISTN